MRFSIKNIKSNSINTSFYKYFNNIKAIKKNAGFLFNMERKLSTGYIKGNEALKDCFCISLQQEVKCKQVVWKWTLVRNKVRTHNKFCDVFKLVCKELAKMVSHIYAEKHTHHLALKRGKEKN